MSSMKKILMVVAIILAVVITIVAIAYISMLVDLYFSFTQNEMYDEHLEYYNDLRHEIRWKVKPTITLDEIFEFDWDCAYVQEHAGMPKEELDAILGFDSDVWPLEVWWGFPCRVLFIKDNQVVIEFKYDSNHMDFAEKEVFIYPDTEFDVLRQGKIVLQKKE